MLTFVVPAIAQHSQDAHADETTATVPLLSEFHDVIYQIWHTAWPEKNVGMLAELLPEVKRYSDSLAHIELPGILRDKKAVWKENVDLLREIAGRYSHATSPLDTQKLMDAAEQLHAQYEKLVRVTRPVLKEIESFHQVLYMLYHHYLPGKDQEKISLSITQLQTAMDLLNAATLPERLKKKEAAFLEARKVLAKSVKALASLNPAKNMKDVEAGVEKMHSDYQALEKVFD